jgi:hypothetical protein
MPSLSASAAVSLLRATSSESASAPAGAQRQYLYFCTSKSSKLSTWRRHRSAEGMRARVGAEGAAPVQQPRVAAHGLVSACFAERKLVSKRLLYVYVTHSSYPQAP